MPSDTAKHHAAAEVGDILLSTYKFAKPDHDPDEYPRDCLVDLCHATIRSGYLKIEDLEAELTVVRGHVEAEYYGRE